ncbi:Protein PLASTID MOVEMENT IMPAIRED 1-RELATED 2 [Linum perenne]
MLDAKCMMLSTVDYAASEDDEKLHSGQLLRDIEAISRALYLHQPQSTAAPSKSVGKAPSIESKPIISDQHHHLSYQKKSLWNWKKSLKSLAHIGHRKFDVTFLFHVHSIQGLPLGFNDFSLSVHWKRKHQVWSTRPSRVFGGVAEFDDTLMHRCSVYGSRTGPHNSAKYDEKLFMIYVSVTETPGIDFGKQWVDLAKLLPCTLQELEGVKSTGKWTTSFALAGKAKGAILNLSFGFSVEREKNYGLQMGKNPSELDKLTHNLSHVIEPRTGLAPSTSDEMLHSIGSVPHCLNHEPPVCFQSVDIKTFNEVPPSEGMELSKSIKFLYQKLSEVNLYNPDNLGALSAQPWHAKTEVSVDLEADTSAIRDDDDDDEFTVIDQGVEIPEKVEFELEREICPPEVGLDGSLIETIDINEIIGDDDESLAAQAILQLQDVVSDGCVRNLSVGDSKDEEKSGSVYGSAVEDREAACLVSGNNDSFSSCNYFIEHDNYMGMKSDWDGPDNVKKSLSLDEFTVANDFLNMLGSDHGSFRMNSDFILESPRERLLREFEKEALVFDDFTVNYDWPREEESGSIGAAGSSCGSICQDFDLPLTIRTGKEEHHWPVEFSSRRTVRLVEDLETEALMREWGLNEDAFQDSPYDCSGGFGSPIDLAYEKPFELPPLGDGFGSLVRTRDGGYLRSLSPSLLGHSKNIQNLILQISCPVVLPATMGCDILEILQHLASVGTQNLAMQIKKLMHIEDLIGKTLKQIVDDTTHDAPHRHHTSGIDSLPEPDAFIGTVEVEGLYPDASILISESNSSGYEMASEYVTLEDLVPLALHKIEALSIQGLRIQSGMSEEKAPASIYPESARESKLLDDREESKRSTVGLLDLSLTLEEWLRIDAGITREGDQVSEQTRTILGAHRAKSIDIIDGILVREGSAVRHGVLGNNLTVAFMMQLRDPLRDYEPVGASMVALIQVERKFLFSKSDELATTSEGCINNEEDQKREDGSIGFKICDVHVCGLNMEPGRTELWGTKIQQQSGVRWLIASGLSCKSNRYPVSESNVIVVSHPKQTSKKVAADILWSISSGWEEGEGFVRNPDVVFPG